MINIGSLAGIDHLALIAASILRINSSRAVIKHQMPVPTLLPEPFTAHLGWAGAGPERGSPVTPENANRQPGNPSSSPNPGGKISRIPEDQPPWKTITTVSLLLVLELNFNFSILPLLPVLLLLVSFTSYCLRFRLQHSKHLFMLPQYMLSVFCLHHVFVFLPYSMLPDLLNTSALKQTRLVIPLEDLKTYLVY